MDRREQLVEFLEKCGYISSASVKSAFETIPRENFVDVKYRSRSYDDTPLPIGNDQTISAPSMIAIMLEVADLKEGLKVLEIGTGSGYNACLIAHIAGEDNVTTIERIESLYKLSKTNIAKCGLNIDVRLKDGTTGFEEKAPYDRIIITAAAPDFPPPLIAQLKTGGKIIAPIGHRGFFQVLKVGTKEKDGTLSVASHGGCVFVPLIGEYGF
ncbi:MAG: protein-L-isoaspartate(D-aspartate) O-methyltransferase [Candidatus Methanofastidiosia archaeon]